MKIKKRKQHNFSPIYLRRGDILTCNIVGENTIGEYVTRTYTEIISRVQAIDTIVTFNVDEFDELEDGSLGIVLGKRKG